MATSFTSNIQSTRTPTPAGAMVRIPSMPMADAMLFTQLIGQYNRGLISCYELLDCVKTQIGTLSDEFEWTPYVFRAGEGLHIALEPRFHNTRIGRISFRLHFFDYE